MGQFCQNSRNTELFTGRFTDIPVYGTKSRNTGPVRGMVLYFARRGAKLLANRITKKGGWPIYDLKKNTRVYSCYLFLPLAEKARSIGGFFLKKSEPKNQME